MAESFDFVIIGSGFGGSVSAMRLTEKGYRVAVLEAGKRWHGQDFPHSNWNARKYLWAPLLRCFGPQKITLLKGVMVLHGSGVGGGSLIYANTMMRPKRKVFEDPSWPKGFDWERELEPHYHLAAQMLGVVTNPLMCDSENALKVLGERLGVADTFHPTEVAVYFGESGVRVPDPYFKGEGPTRTGCNGCGGCMIGCRFDAKNTLDKNYLYLAEKKGAQVFAETHVTQIVPEGDGYRIETKKSCAWLPTNGPTFRAKRVIVAAGVLGTLDLLLKSRDVYKTLPKLSQRLGDRVRTNGESLLGATSFDSKPDFSKGIAIGAAIHPDEQTKIETVRYPSKSSMMRLLALPLTPDGTKWTRPLKLVARIFMRAIPVARLWMLKDWARSTIILLVMQSDDRQMRLSLGSSLLSFGRKTLRGRATDKPIPSFIAIAQKAAQILAREIKGEAQNIVSEVALATPATAHILGGACMADSAAEGVIDRNHEVFGHPGLFVCDGSVVPANLGINPSLTITALAERFAAQFTKKI